ncbi:MAG: UDP-N-acetylmuramoyl-L-alanyl-D-glutamate--2,6-diaminopimelate ligase [Chloroflexota bacterium]
MTEHRREDSGSASAAGYAPGAFAGSRAADGPTIAERLRAAEPDEPRPLSSLVTRLRERFDDATLVAPESEATAGPHGDTWISGIAADSRRVGKGNLFVAIPGARSDGHAFATAATRSGAAAVLAEHRINGLAVPQVIVRGARAALAEAAAWWYGDPSHELGVVGITGTDGKTTTGFMAVAALQAAGVSSGLISTVATRIGGRTEPNHKHSTTPEAPELQRALRAMVLSGDRVATIETTSHGLAMDRVGAIAYDVAILTNVTHEHLELHGTFEAYRDAKMSLFRRLALPHGSRAVRQSEWPSAGIVNSDDPSAPLFIDAAGEAGARILTYGRSDRSTARLTAVRDDPGGLVVFYQLAGRDRAVHLRLKGRFNAYNTLAVVCLGVALDLDPDAVDAGLAGLERVPGRMEQVDRGQPFTVVIDYAHSPASLAAVLEELAALSDGRGGLIAVFGSAGDRDVAKRPLMGRIAAEHCRLIVLTDEDPRGEDGSSILRDIAAGVRRASSATSPVPPVAVLEIPDRGQAIREAFRQARPGDTVLLAGKGHETTIEYADGAKAWNEYAEAMAALAELGWTD